MSRKFIDIGLLIINAYRSIKNDKSYLIPFIMPIILILVAFFHFWYVLHDLVTFLLSYQYVQDPSSINFFISFLNQNILTLVIMGFVYGFLILILYIIASSSIIKKYAIQRKGEILEINNAISYSFRNFPRIFATTLLAGLIIILPILLIIIPIFLGIINGSMALVVIGLIIMLIVMIPLIYIGLKLSFFLQACIIEEIGPVESIKRSWAVTKGNLLRIFVISLLIGILGAIIGIPFTIAGSAGIISVQLIGSIVTYFIIWPISSIIFASLYIEITEPLKY